jgi:hypothetical protein
MADGKELAWLAGFIDGEGSICIEKDTPRHQLVLRIANSHRPSIEECARIGGSHIDKHVQEKGLTPTGRQYKPSYSVRWFNHRAVALLRLLYPYLRTKRLQAETAFLFMESMPNTGRGAPPLSLDQIRGREDARLRMRQLNRTGVA